MKHFVEIFGFIWTIFLGKFKTSRLKLLKKEPGSIISSPSDFRHTITVQHTLDPKGIGGAVSPNNPPGSPAIPRLRAIARKYGYFGNVVNIEKNVQQQTIQF